MDTCDVEAYFSETFNLAFNKEELAKRLGAIDDDTFKDAVSNVKETVIKGEMVNRFWEKVDDTEVTIRLRALISGNLRDKGDAINDYTNEIVDDILDVVVIEFQKKDFTDMVAEKYREMNEEVKKAEAKRIEKWLSEFAI